MIEAPTGKLIWSRQGPAPVTPQRDQNYGGYSGASGSVVPPLAIGQAERIFLAMPEGIECWSADDGRLLWRGTGFHSGTAGDPVRLTLFTHRDVVLVCNPFTASIAALDAATGKARWQRDYPQKSSTPVPLHPLNCGAYMSDGRVLMYGSATWIVSAETGDVQWSFEPRRVRDFPIALSEAASSAPVGAPGLTSVYSRNRLYRSRGGVGGNMEFLAVDYSQRARFGRGWMPHSGQRMALTHTAAAWAGMMDEYGQPRFAVLHGDQMLLFTSQGMSALRLDLPGGPGKGSGSGTFLGVAGRAACLLAGHSLSVAHLDTGLTTNISLVGGAGDAANFISFGGAPQSQEHFEAAVDGQTIYVSGLREIAAYHARTGRRIFQAPWPASVAPKPSAASTGREQSISYLPQGRLRSGQGNISLLQPPAALVHDGVFYTLSDPSRVVALAGEKGAGEAP